MTSNNADGVNIVNERTDNFVGDSTISSAGSTADLAEKVADDAPHSFDIKRMLFCRLTLPFILIVLIQLYYQREDCRSSYKDVEDVSANLCFNPFADAIHVCFFIAIQMIGYQVRKELILRSPIIFDFVKHMTSSDIKDLDIKNKKEWVKALTGRQKRFRPWNIRGQLLFPTIVFLGLFLWLLYEGYYEKNGDSTWRSCRTGVSYCGSNNEWVTSNASVVLIAMCYSLSWTFVAHTVVIAIYPLTLVSLIVGPSTISRIGLWNQRDKSLGEVQRVSMHASLYLSGAAFLLILFNFQYAVYFDTTCNGARIIYIVAFLFVLVTVLLLPIIHAIFALRIIKENLLADVVALEENANKNFSDILGGGFEEHLQCDMVRQAETELARIAKYRLRVQDASVVPSSLALIKTSVSSVLIGIVLPVVLSRLQ